MVRDRPADPLLVPFGLAFVVAFALYRYRYEADDFGAILAVLAALAGLAAMSLGHFLDLEVWATILVAVALLVIPFITLVLLLIMSGAASDPTVE